MDHISEMNSADNNFVYVILLVLPVLIEVLPVLGGRERRVKRQHVPFIIMNQWPPSMSGMCFTSALVSMPISVSAKRGRTQMGSG